MNVRSTVPGVLAHLGPPRPQPPGGEIGHVGVFSVVTGDPTKKMRKLPTLYVRTTPMFADREVQPVVARLEELLDVVRAREPHYAATACEFAGKRGLYAYDLYNRSGFRRKLARAEMSFSEWPYTRFVEGQFESTASFRFVPEFVILPQRGEDLVVTKGAYTAFYLSTLRFGAIHAGELGSLASTLKDVPALSTGDPSTLLRAL